MKKSLVHVILKKYGRLVIAMILVSSLGCGIMSGMSNGFLSLKQSLNRYVEEDKYPDIYVNTEITTMDYAERLRAIEGIEAVDARLMGNISMINKEGRFLPVQAMTYSEDEFQEFYFWEKGEEKGDYPVLLGHQFCEDNGFHVGDEIEIRMDEEVRIGTVYGIVTRPEIIAPATIAGIKILSSDVGFLYVPSMAIAKEENKDHTAALKEWEEKNDEYEEAVIDAEKARENALKEIEEAKKELDRIEGELNDGLKKAADKKNELLKNREELAKKLKELDDLEKDLNAKEDAVAQGWEQVATKEAQASDARKKIDEGLAQIEEQLADLDEKEAELKKQKELLDEKKADLDWWKNFVLLLQENQEGLQELVNLFVDENELYENSSMALMILQMLIPNTQEVVEKIEEAKQKLITLNEQITARENSEFEYADYVLHKQMMLDELAKIGITEDHVDIFIDYYKKLVDNLQIFQGMIIDLVDAIEQDVQDYDVPDSLFREAQNFLNEHLLNKEISQEVIDAALKFIEKKEAEIADGYAQIEDYEKQIADGRALLAEKRKEAEEGLSKLNDAGRQIQDGRNQLTSASEQIRDGRRQIAEGRNQANALLAQIDRGIREIDANVRNGETEIADAKETIRKAEAELDDQWNSAQEELGKAKEKLTDAKAELDEWKGYDNYCNQFMIRLASGVTESAVTGQIEAALDGVEVNSITPYESSTVKEKIDDNVDPIEIMAVYVPVLFYGVALIVVFLFMTLLVRHCRREIGILRALGFSRNHIVLQFCLVNLAASVGAVIIGLLIGLAVTGYIGFFFKDYFDLYKFAYVFNVKRFLISTGLVIAVGQTATIASTGYVSRISPSEAMSRPAPAKAFTAGKAFKNVSPFVKYCILSILRNKGRFIFAVVCLSMSVMLIFMAFAFDASKDEIPDNYFIDRINYNAEIFLKGEAKQDMIDRITESGYAKNPEIISYYNKNMIANGVVKSVTIKAIDPATEKIHIFDDDGIRLNPPLDGILLERHTAEALGVSVGDEVIIDGLLYKVTGICAQHEFRYQYISKENAKSLGKADIHSILVDADEKDEIALLDVLSKEENYAYASFTSRSYKDMQHTFLSFTVCVWVVIGFSVVIGLVIVINTLLTNLQEQKKDLCVLRTLGFQHSELSARLFVQAGLYLLCSLLLGIPLGIVTTKFVLTKMEIESRSYPFVNAPYLYFVTIGVVLAYVLISHLLSMRSLKKWDIVESVKDKE